MSDSQPDDIEAIRERKREELTARAGVPGEPIHIESREQFSDVIEQYPVVLVDLYADWCGPCKMLEPTIETLAADSDAAVAKVDVDAHQDIAREYNVQGVPTLLLFAEGDLSERVVGVKDEETLRSLIDSAV
jgi:thioredoxin 1